MDQDLVLVVLVWDRGLAVRPPETASDRKISNSIPISVTRSYVLEKIYGGNLNFSNLRNRSKIHSQEFFVDLLLSSS